MRCEADVRAAPSSADEPDVWQAYITVLKGDVDAARQMLIANLADYTQLDRQFNAMRDAVNRLQGSVYTAKRAVDAAEAALQRARAAAQEQAR